MKIRKVLSIKMQVDEKFNNPVNYLVSYIQGLLIFVLLIIVNCRFIFGRFIFNWDLFSWYFLMCYLLLPIENILFEKLRGTFKKNNRMKSLTHSSKNKPIHFSSTLKLSMYDNPNEDMTIRAYLLALEMIGAPLVLFITIVLIWIRRKLL
ncbi:hypothetical protein ABN16_09135 [Levilactobacillus koreensis]|uniref:Uncharacterized protein n=1 Tax=Levilactobacillus koreensis TaxID=637971 RepID=A0AAC9ER65_9LACO|nr:hypothetical protein ABN16_09135 [Levilactobacillus koreensis]